MEGVFLVAAELAGRGFIASPTSRSAAAADLLVTNQRSSRTFSVQVKTNKVSPGHFQIGKSTVRAAHGYIFVLVNIRPKGPHAARIRDIALAMSITVKDDVVMADWPMVKCNIATDGDRIYHLPIPFGRTGDKERNALPDVGRARAPHK